MQRPEIIGMNASDSTHFIPFLVLPPSFYSPGMISKQRGQIRGLETN